MMNDKYFPVLVAVSLLAAPVSAENASYVTSGEFLSKSRPFEARAFVETLVRQPQARAALKTLIPKEEGLLISYLDSYAAQACRRRHAEMNFDRTDFQDFFRRTALAQERLSAACGLLEKGEARASLKNLDEALALDPRFLDALLHRAIARERLGDAEAAGRDFLAAQKVPAALSSKVEGVCACTPALAAVAKSIADRIDLGHQANARGVALFRAGKSTEALAEFAEAIARNPADADAFISRAVVHQAAGDAAGALRDYEAAARLTAGSPEVHARIVASVAALKDRIAVSRKAPPAPASREPVVTLAAGGPPAMRGGVAYAMPQQGPPMRGIDDTEYDENLKRFVRATSLLRRGRTREGIAKLKELSDSLSANADYAFLYFESLSELGGAYLRTAPEPACRRPGQSDLCLFPGGVQDLRADPKDAEESIRVVETLLAIRPMDLQARWLLNLAYMAAGRYPAGVPAQWLIPKASFGTDAGLKLFRDAAPAVGVDVLSHAGGSIMEDFDGDGSLDIMASSLRGDEQLRFLRNKGDGTFEDLSGKPGLKGIGGGLHIVQTDYNNDGRPDVFIPRQLDSEAGSDGHCTLLKNLGGGLFEDATLRAGLSGLRPSQVAVWADYDNDGWLDLFLGNDDMKTGQGRLFRNKGDGTFVDVTKDAGLLREGFVVGANWGDFDNDGRIDLYISYQYEDNALYRNLGPKGFQDVTAKAGVAGPRVSFSAWFWDFDNDGWEDLFVFDFPMTPSAEGAAADTLGMKYHGNHPRLYRNRHDGTFEDVAEKSGLDRSVMAMGANFGDLDNDGWLDFYGGTGNPDLRATVPNLAFRSEEGKSFREVTAATGMGLLEKGHGIAFGDIDNDGDEDIYAEMGGVYDADAARNSLFINPGSGNRWITLLLEGTRSNKAAIGARIRVDVRTAEGKRSIHRTVTTGGSFGANSFQAEIGLGKALAVEAIEILWPATGKKQIIADPPMDRSLKIVEGASGFKLLERKPIALRGS